MARTTTKTSTAKPAEKVAAPDLMKALVEGLAAEGVKATPRWNPKRTYASLMVGKANVGYVFKQTARGMRVEPAASKAQLPKGGSKIFKPGTRSALFALVGTVKTEADVAEAVKVIKAGADARGRSEQPKAAPAKAAAKK